MPETLPRTPAAIGVAQVPRSALLDPSQQALFNAPAAEAPSFTQQETAFAAPAAVEAAPQGEASPDARPWAGVPNVQLGTSLKRAEKVLRDPNATQAQRDAAERIRDIGRREYIARTGGLVLTGAVEVVSRPQEAAPATQPEVSKRDPAETYFEGLPSEALERARGSMLASVRTSMAELRDNLKYTPDITLRAERTAGRDQNVEDYNRVATNLLSMQRVLTRRQLHPGASEPFRGRTPEGVIVPTRLDPAAVKEFADELFGAYGEDAYALVAGMAASTNRPPNPQEAPSNEERQQIAERLELMLNVRDQLLRDSRPGWQRQGLEAKYASIHAQTASSRQAA